MSPKEVLTQALDGLSDADLERVADYVAFLRFREHLRATPPHSVAQTAALYAEAAEDERALAEEGMTQYYRGLAADDKR